MVLLSDPLCDRKSESSATFRSAASFVDAVEPLEDLVLLLRRDAHSRIFHTNDHAPGSLLKLQTNRTRRRSVLERIVEQDIRQPSKQRLIAIHKRSLIAATFADIGRKLKIAQGGHLLPTLSNAAQRGIEVHWPEIQSRSAG